MMAPEFPPDERSYFLDDERLRAFRALTPEQRLLCVEELAAFLRLARIARRGMGGTTHPVSNSPTEIGS